ncbi:ParB N-terminal domain-containing protein [candidate division KSB1 bacterium]|nr:ParB N-terminal domain-containing protein [candidate division KSB1 bacterium]
MMLKTNTVNIKLSEVDLSDRTYILTFEPMMSQMVQSIREIGLVNPPILAQISSEPRYRVISGLKRILGLIHLKKEMFPARIVQEQPDKPSIEYFLINFYENLSTRALNDVEKSIILNKLITKFNVDKETILQHYVPLLGLGKNPRVLDMYLPIVRLEDNIKIAIVEDILSHELALHMIELSGDDRQSLFHLFVTLKLGKNRQKEFMRLLTDIAKSTERSLRDVVDQPALMAVVNDEKITSTQKVERVRDLLRKMRYPRLAEAELYFEEVKKELKLPPRIVLKHSPFFESDIYSLELLFRDPHEFQKMVTKVNDISRTGAMDKLKKVGK